MNPHQTRLDAEKETFGFSAHGKAEICRITRAVRPRKQRRPHLLGKEPASQPLADPISAPPQRRPVGTKTAKNPTGGVRQARSRPKDTRIWIEQWLLSAGKEMVRERKGKVAALPGQAKAMGSAAAEVRAGGKEGSWAR